MLPRRGKSCRGRVEFAPAAVLSIHKVEDAEYPRDDPEAPIDNASKEGGEKEKREMTEKVGGEAGFGMGVVGKTKGKRRERLLARC